MILQDIQLQTIQNFLSKGFEWFVATAVVFTIAVRQIENSIGNSIRDAISSSVSYSKLDRKYITKTKSKVYTPKYKKRQKSGYYKAERKPEGGIKIGEPISIETATIRVRINEDVYAVSRIHAETLALFVGGYSPESPEIHGWSPLNKSHYHLKGHIGGHIFYD